MSQFEQTRALPPIMFAIIVLVMAAVAALLGPLISLFPFDTRYLVAILMAFVFIFMLLMPNDAVMKTGLTLWVLSFGLGWRTVHITSRFDIHPTEVLTYFLFFMLLIRGLMERQAFNWKIPYSVLAFAAFAILGVAPIMARGRPVELTLQELKVYLPFIPTFYVVQWLVKTPRMWQTISRWCILVGVYISLLGIIDIVAPSLSQALTSNQDVVTTYSGGIDDFERVGFVFYGSFMAGFQIFMFFGFALAELMTHWQARDRRMTTVFGAAVLIMLGGMYLSGYRGLWYSVAGFMALTAVLNRRTVLLVVAAIAAIPLLPESFYIRAQSLFNLQYADSSFFNRLDRAQFAINNIVNYPLNGVGFGSSGYVHSDLLQITATLGVPAILVFFVFYAQTLLRLFGLSRRDGWFGLHARVMLAYFCAQLVVFAGEGLIVWVQLMIPFWFICGMVYKLIALAEQAEPAVTEAVPSVELRSYQVSGANAS